jgi:hypothetical protein
MVRGWNTSLLVCIANCATTREVGSPLDPGKIYATFVRLVRQSGLSDLKLHGLRHMNVSLQLESRRVRDGHRDAGRAHFPGTDPLDLRAPDRQHRATSR